MAYHFNNRIEIIELVPASGPEVGGGDEEVTIFKPWADIKTMQGSEVQNLGLSGHELSSRFIIRYREGIKHNHKIKFKGETYDIVSITNDNEKNRTITLIGKAVT